MELLHGEAFDDLFKSFTAQAFHLEVNDSYNTSEESGPFQLFLDDQPDDYSWHQPWLDLVAHASRQGKQINRVRIISVPHADYTRWGLHIARLNLAAGEDIRWLPRHRADPTALPEDDFWLFDDRLVVFTVFEPSGQFAGGAATTDPVTVQRCATIRDHVWSLAIPHERYTAQGSNR